MTGFTTTSRGRYKCLFCSHPTYKTMSGVLTHVQGIHALELAEATIEEMRGALDRANNKPPVIKEKIVYKEKADPKYWYVRNYGMEGIYCTTCKQVQTGVGIPYGQTIENTPHQCGNRTLLPVVEVK